MFTKINVQGKGLAKLKMACNAVLLDNHNFDHTTGLIYFNPLSPLISLVILLTVCNTNLFNVSSESQSLIGVSKRVKGRQTLVFLDGVHRLR